MSNNFEEIKISERMKNNLSALGYTSLTTIQEKVIPIILSGKDLIGQSSTGTGKTAAFLIPIIESIEPDKNAQALILAPTRELAIQIKEEGLKLVKGMNVNIIAVYGGENIENQINQLKSKSKSEIIVGTPGRVIDHLNRRTLRLNNLKFFVLDEVDEMLKRGFIDDIRSVAEQAKSDKLQTLFFSATISKETKSLSNDFLRNPVFINNVTKDAKIRPLITQHYLLVKGNKLSNLIDIIHFQNPELAIVFAGTKRMVDIISDEISSEGFLCDKIHSDLSQKQRTNVYNKFKNKKIRFLVATDIAARGIDVEGISHVYNYDFPQDPEFYIHRIGRTGRAGLSGQSLILFGQWELKRYLPFLEKLTGEKLQPIYRPSKEEIEEIIENNTLKKVIEKIEKSKDELISEKFSKLLEVYNPEQILKGLVKFFSLKRKKTDERIEQKNNRKDVYSKNSSPKDGSNRRFKSNRSSYSERNSFQYEKRNRKINNRYSDFNNNKW